MKSWFILMGMLWGLSGALPAENEPFPDSIPTKLVVHIDGIMRPLYSMELSGDLVTYKWTDTSQPQGKDIKTLSIRPGKKAWARFIKEINAAKLYRWSKLYMNHPPPEVMDGTHWTIDMEVDGRKFHSEGYNSYPVDGDEAKPADSERSSPPYDRLCQAVSHLVGQEFQ